MSSTARDPKVDALNGVIVALKPLEKEEQRNVLKTAAEWLAVEAPAFVPAPPSGMPPPSQANGGSQMANTGDLQNLSPKEFLRVKGPKTDVQRVACLGYILQSQGKSPFNSRELN